MINDAILQDKYTTVCSHPLCKHTLATIRDKNTSSEVFRNAVKRLTYLLVYAATSDLELEDITVQTPICECKTEILRRDKKIIIAPILRAGLIFSDVTSKILPNAEVRHIGMYRDETTLKPVWYYDKTPIEFDEPENTLIFLLDPMLATGNSALDAIKLFVNKKVPVENIRFISLLAAPEGLANIRKYFPTIKITTAHIDEKLNENGYIVPGLGDAGDRIFNTLK